MGKVDASPKEREVKSTVLSSVPPPNLEGTNNRQGCVLVNDLITDGRSDHQLEILAMQGRRDCQKDPAVGHSGILLAVTARRIPLCPLLPSAPRTAHLPQPQQEGVAKQTQRSLPTQTPVVTAKAAASARPMHAMPVAQVAQRSLLGKTSCSGGMHQDAIAAIKSGRSGVTKQCCDELQESVAGLQAMATTSALDADVDKKCLLRTSKHPKASIEGGSAMGEWEDVVTALRKQQRMGPDAAVDQIRVGRAGRGKRIPVASQRRTSGRSEVSDSIPADAADPTPALAYPGAFENMSFDQRCECCRLATTSNISRDFSPLPNPKPGDWLSCQEEKGQSVKAFMSRTRAMNARPGPARMTLYVQPLGSIDLDQISAAKNLEDRQRQILKLQTQKGLQNLELMLPGSRFLQLLESFLRAFFLGMKVKILPYKQIDLTTVGFRGGKDDAANEWQLNAGDLLYKALPRLSGQARAHDGYALPTFTRSCTCMCARTHKETYCRFSRGHPGHVKAHSCVRKNKHTQVCLYRRDSGGSVSKRRLELCLWTRRPFGTHERLQFRSVCG